MEKEQSFGRLKRLLFGIAIIKWCGLEFYIRLQRKKVSFRELIKTDDIDYFEKMLRYKLDDSIKESHESWMQFKLNLWNKGIELAREYSKKYLDFILTKRFSSTIEVYSRTAFVVIC